MRMFNEIYFCLAVEFCMIDCGSIPKATLTGVTLLYEPYIILENETYTGFLVDLMDKIAEKSGIDYQLTCSLDGEYEFEDENDNIAGLIGQMLNKSVDFVLVDVTITDQPQQWVDFTEPFLVNPLAALVLREDAKNLTTLEDLVQRNEQMAASGNLEGQLDYGVVQHGQTYEQLSKSTDPIGKMIFEQIQANLSESQTNAFTLKRVEAGLLAYIDKSSIMEWYRAQNCNLKVLPDTRSLYDRQYAVALQKESNYLEPFSKAIRELKLDGSIDKWKQIYWISNCTDEII